MKLNQRQHGGTLVGIFVGVVVGILISFGVVFVMNKTPLPFRDHGWRTDKTSNGDSGQTGTIAPLPGKPGDKVGAKSDEKPGDKPRFEFYKILPGSEESVPTPDPKPAPDAKAKPGTMEPQYLQVGSFQKPADADNLKAKLALIGLDAGVQEVDLPEKGTMYRVRMGPFSSVEEMNRARGLLSQNGIQTTTVKAK